MKLISKDSVAAKLGVHASLSVAVLLSVVGCVGPTPGPDKQFEGTFEGAATGAGAGAVTGFQVGAGAGPGALVGAGFGAVAGGIHGFVRDRTEENLLELSMETDKERQRAIAHEIISDQYKRRMELHPTRDIYPADIFFFGDQVRLRGCSKAIVEEIVYLNKTRMPWSRFQIAVYTKSADNKSAYAYHLSEERAKALGNMMVTAGIEPRRIETKAVIVDAPILIDPADDPGRYNQAVEFIPVDR